MKSRRTKVLAAAFAATTLLGFATACSSDEADAETTSSSFVSKSILEAGQANPMIAQGVAIGGDTAIYKTSGIGPSAGNKAAPEGSPESYIDGQFSGGVLRPVSPSPRRRASMYSRRSATTSKLRD